MRRQNIVISMGDPAGISPDIIAKTLVSKPYNSNVLITGHWPTLASALSRVGCDVEVVQVDCLKTVEGKITVLSVAPGDTPIDTPGERSARVQFDALERAVDAVLDYGFDAIVTGPVSKKAIATVAPGFTGHTEYLAQRSGLSPDDVTMVFASETLFVGLISTHVPMREVPEALTLNRLSRTFEHLRQMVSLVRPTVQPRIGVAALNPHAGEEGLFGREETELLIPFCEKMSEKNGVKVVGPLPADAIYREALSGRLDAVVAAYHDQAMIPLKLAGPGRTVNVTMGLPFVRTSPDHGVAYDIARTGRADPGGFQLALKLAETMAFERLTKEAAPI